MITNAIWSLSALLILILSVLLDGVQWPSLPHAPKGDSAITAGAIGIIGAFIGAWAGYRFNVKLESKRTKERRLIQTKNTILSPIYKQLLGLKDYLNEQAAADSHPKILVYFTDYSRYGAYTFNIWENVKKDIRKRYVPQSSQDKLEELTRLIAEHLKLQEKSEPIDKDIAYRFYEAHKAKLSDSRLWNHYMLAGTLTHHIGGADDPENEPNMVDAQLRAGFNFSENEYEQYTIQLVEEATTAHDRHYSELAPSFQCVVFAVNTVAKSFEKMVDNIIEKYEGGIDVE